MVTYNISSDRLTTNGVVSYSDYGFDDDDEMHAK